MRLADESVSHPRCMRKIGYLVERKTKGCIMGTWWGDKNIEKNVPSTSCFKTLHVLADSILLLDMQIANPGPRCLPYDQRLRLRQWLAPTLVSSMFYYPLLALGLCVWNEVAWYDVRGDEAADRLVPFSSLMAHHLIGALLRGVLARARPRLPLHRLVATERVGLCFSTARHVVSSQKLSLWEFCSPCIINMLLIRVELAQNCRRTTSYKSNRPVGGLPAPQRLYKLQIKSRHGY